MQCRNCGLSESEIFEVKKRSVLRLEPGRYTINVHYDLANIEVSSNLNGMLEVGDIPSPANDRFRAKVLVLNYPDKPVRIVCNEKISIASLIEGI